MQTAGAGDDNELSQLVKKHKPGEKGWPTIRHFNARTGPQGETYARKLAGKALAEELVTEALLQIYIEEESGDVLCSVATRDGCTDKQIRFISLWCMKSGEEMLAQRERLMAMVGGVMKPALRGWIGERIAILSQLTRDSAARDAAAVLAAADTAVAAESRGDGESGEPEL